MIGKIPMEYALRYGGPAVIAAASKGSMVSRLTKWGVKIGTDVLISVLPKKMVKKTIDGKEVVAASKEIDYVAVAQMITGLAAKFMPQEAVEVEQEQPAEEPKAKVKLAPDPFEETQDPQDPKAE